MLKPENYMLVRTFIEQYWEEFVFHCNQFDYDEDEAESVLEELGDTKE